MSLQQINKTNK